MSYADKEVDWLAKLAVSEAEVVFNENTGVAVYAEAKANVLTADAREVRLADLIQKDSNANLDALIWSDALFSVKSDAGVNIGQASAMQSTAVWACVNRLSVDLAKLKFYVFKTGDQGEQLKLTLKTPGLSSKLKAFLTLLRKPNAWQTWFDFAVQMQAGLVLRGNAYAVIVSDIRGIPQYLVPINPDKVSLWEAPDGNLYYMVTRSGLHQMSVLADVDLLVPFDEMFHIKGISSNGLLGVSPITSCREAIGLNLAQQKVASNWLGNGSRPSGILTTPNKLTDDAAKRLKADWKTIHTSAKNSGSVALLEQGLTWVPLTINSADMEFIESRKLQLQEIARIFDVPLHMLADPVAVTNRGVTPTQQSQAYFNQTISTYVEIWSQRMLAAFDLYDEDVDIGVDYSILLRGDVTTRWTNYRGAIAGGFLSPNEARIDDGRAPKPGGDNLMAPSNTTPFGSNISGTAPDGAGHPPNEPDGNPDQPGATKPKAYDEVIEL